MSISNDSTLTTNLVSINNNLTEKENTTMTTSLIPTSTALVNTNNNSTWRTNKMNLITDEQLIEAVYKWNLLFFEGRMIATKEPADEKKYKYLIKNEERIKEQAYNYLKYYKEYKDHLHANSMDFVNANLRTFMENLNPPRKKEKSHYNNIPVSYI